MYGFCGVYGGMVSIIWYGMVWYGAISKHRQKDNLKTSGSVLERLEAFWRCLNAFRKFWKRMGAFGRLRLVSLIPYVSMFVYMYVA